jgi:hypothetical protein
MKQAIFIGLFMALLTTVNSQVSINLPVGVSTLKTPTIGMNLQANIKSLIVATGFDSHVSPKVGAGQFFWGRLGASLPISELNQVEITGGVGHYRVSADIKGANKSLGLVNIQYVHQTERRPELALFASVTATKEFTMFAGGIRFIFGRSKNGCPANSIR